MARWKLRTPHYLNTLDNEWEYKEVSRTSGRQATKRFKVPRYFDPGDPGDCDRNGECIVCHEDKGQRGDHVFFGTPTPDMEPIDDEAQAITDELTPGWSHPIEGLPSAGEYSQSLLQAFEKQLTQAIQRAGGIPDAPPVAISNVNLPATDDPRLAALEKQVQQLQALLGAVAPAPEAVEPVEEEEPELDLPSPAPPPTPRPQPSRRA